MTTSGCCSCFLVIIGHGLELFMRGKTVGLYRIIYSFHMPAFLFLNGRLAKFDNKKVFKHLIIPYFVFQTLYLSFDAAVMKDGAEVTLQYTTPYWILWYLMVIIIYYILIPMLPPKGSRGVYTVLPCSFLLALLAGYDKTLGYYLSLSRASVFAPFFLFGYYYDDIACRFEMIRRKRLFKAILTVSCLLMICLGEYYIVKTKIPYYQELIEERWAETEPGIRLVRAEYNCYHDPDPKDTDVIMYDAFMLEDLIRNGWIQPIAEEDVQDAGDIYPFALDGLTADGKL